MSLPSTIPSFISLIPVNVSSVRKTFTLPVASTNQGRLLVFKDAFGYSSNSSIALSTTGADILERSTTTGLFLNTNFGAWSLTNDGLNRWFILDSYTNSLYSTRFVLSNFSAGALTIAGNTTYANNALVLTTTASSLASSAYFPQKMSIGRFDTEFLVRFDNTQADGMALVIQNASSNALGAFGYGLGYQGINGSVAIRLDTYNGGGVPAGLGQFSTDILSNGTVATDQGASGVLNSFFGGLTSNTTWNFSVRATYNGTTLSYSITNTANNTIFTSNAAVNIPSIVAANTAWIGFTGGTGGAGQGCTVTQWSFRNI
jgi:hypothetical protein